MDKNNVPLRFGILASSITIAALFLQGCTSSPKLASGGLQFTNGMTEEPQLSRAIARFCDSAYIAVNQSQEITPFDVLSRYEKIQSARKQWASPYVVAELTKASLISNKRTELVVERYEEIEKLLAKKANGDQIAELAKASIITDTDADVVASTFREFENSNRKWQYRSSQVELTKLALFTDKSASTIFATYDEFKIRQGKIGGELELVELTKSAALTGRTPNDLVKMFDQIERLDRGWVSRAGTAELVKLSILTNSSPKTVYYRYTEIAAKKKGASADRTMELLRLSLLGKRSSSEVVKLYETLNQMEGDQEPSKEKTLSMVSGELLQDSVFGNHVDECNGGYARLLLSIDSYRGEE